MSRNSLAALALVIASFAAAGASRAQTDPLKDPGVARIRDAFKVDGIALFDPHATHAARMGVCAASIFAGLKWCVSGTAEETKGNAVYIKTTGYNIDAASRIVYAISTRRSYPLKREEFDAIVQAIAERYGAGAAVYAFKKSGEDAGSVDSLIAVWGGLRLVHLTEADYAVVEAGGSLKRGHLVDHRFNLVASAKQREPIYRLEGEAGYILHIMATSPDRADIIARVVYPPVFQPAPGKPSAEANNPLVTESVRRPTATSTPEREADRGRTSGEDAARSADAKRIEAERGLAAERLLRAEAERKLEEERAARAEIERKAAAKLREAEERAKKAEDDLKAKEEGRRKEEGERKAAEERAKRAERERLSSEDRRRAEEADRKQAEQEKRAAEERAKRAELERKTLEERRLKEEAERKAAEERARRAEAARKALEEGRKKDEVERKAAEERAKRAEEAERKAADEKRAEEERRRARPEPEHADRDKRDRSPAQQPQQRADADRSDDPRHGSSDPAAAERKAEAERLARERAARPENWQRMAADAAKATGAIWSFSETQDKLADERVLRSQTIFAVAEPNGNGQAANGRPAVEVIFECTIVGGDRRLRALARGFDRKSGAAIAFRTDAEGTFGVKTRFRLDDQAPQDGLVFRERQDDLASILEVPMTSADLGKKTPRAAIWLRHYATTLEFNLVAGTVPATITPYADNLRRVLEACAQ